METRKVAELKWREDLYPRREPDPATIQQYAESIDLLPPRGGQPTQRTH